jgi:hypothetical protein
VVQSAYTGCSAYGGLAASPTAAEEEEPCWQVYRNMSSLDQGESFETLLFLSALKCEKETHSFVVSHKDQVVSACERCFMLNKKCFTNYASWEKFHLKICKQCLTATVPQK